MTIEKCILLTMVKPISRFRESITEVLVRGNGIPPSMNRAFTILSRIFPPFGNHIYFKLLSLDFAARDLVSLEGDQKVPSIELFMALHEKDLTLLDVVLRSALETSLNPISKITIVAQKVAVAESKSVLVEIQRDFSEMNFEVIPEDEYLDISILEACSNFGETRGWLLQQCIKLTGAASSVSAGVLLLDADTIFLQKILWLDSDFESFVWATHHYSTFLGHFTDAYPEIPISPVEFGHCGHSLLCKPRVLEEFFAELDHKVFRSYQQTKLEGKANPLPGDRFARVLVNLLETLGPNLAEYELYAKYALRKDSKKTHLRRFSNYSISRNRLEKFGNLWKLTEAMKKKTASISLHLHEPKVHEIDW
jgi:hypothetical protein